MPSLTYSSCQVRPFSAAVVTFRDTERSRSGYLALHPEIVMSLVVLSPFHFINGSIYSHHLASLLRGQGPAGDELVQLLVGVVDDELLEPVALRYLEAVEVEDADHVVFPRSLHLVEIKWRSRVTPY